jgi:hypothetical protein
MKQEEFNNWKEILKAGSPEVYQAIVDNEGVMKEPGELPVTQATKVYTRRRDHLEEKGNSVGAGQIGSLLKNLSGMPNTNISLLSVYFDFGGFTIFISSSNKLLGIYNVDTNKADAIAFQERSKEAGSSYPKLYKLSAGNVGDIID